MTDGGQIATHRETAPSFVFPGHLGAPYRHPCMAPTLDKACATTLRTKTTQNTNNYHPTETQPNTTNNSGRNSHPTQTTSHDRHKSVTRHTHLNGHHTIAMIVHGIWNGSKERNSRQVGTSIPDATNGPTNRTLTHAQPDTTTGKD